MTGQGTPQKRFQQRFQRGLRKGFPTGVKRTVVVHSGKGGVGKTFVAVNIARALADNGLKVGLLDADIDCPNALKTLEMDGDLIANAEKKIIPLEKDGLKAVSMAPLLGGEHEALLWRGPRLSRAVEQLVHDTDWGELDFLIVDAPPGTSDVPLSILQVLEGAEMLLVTTPQDTAVMDAMRSAKMAQRLKIDVIGVIENMAGVVFGEGGGERLAKELGVPLLASILLKAEFAKGARPESISNMANQNIFQ